MLDRYTALALLVAAVVTILVNVISQRMRTTRHLAAPATKIRVQQTPSTSAASRSSRASAEGLFVLVALVCPEPLRNIRVPA